jgi:hypothetical protein
MVELRWLVRAGWDGPEKFLQMRQQYDKTIRAGMFSHEDIQRTASMAWSEWKDVPVVKESELL